MRWVEGRAVLQPEGIPTSRFHFLSLAANIRRLFFTCGKERSSMVYNKDVNHNNINFKFEAKIDLLDYWGQLEATIVPSTPYEHHSWPLLYRRSLRPLPSCFFYGAIRECIFVHCTPRPLTTRVRNLQLSLVNFESSTTWFCPKKCKPKIFKYRWAVL